MRDPGKAAVGCDASSHVGYESEAEGCMFMEFVRRVEASARRARRLSASVGTSGRFRQLSSEKFPQHPK
jgi:hypothetical protein